jgi:hypothetical protein
VAILKNKKTGEKKQVSFGDKSYEHYEDKIGEYKHLDHKDPERRKRYKQRHGDNPKKFSAGYFALKYLW